MALSTTGAGAGASAPSVAASTILGVRAVGEAPEVVIERPRLFDGGGGVTLEPEAGDSADAVKAVGHTLLPPASIGRTNMVFCATGAVDKCSLLTDPRGSGLAVRPN
jgi:gamma-glutamyltranspeptidase